MVKKDELGYTYYTDAGIEFAKSIFDTINEVKQQFIEENEVTYSINIEQIPGESAAAKMQS